jgi:uroporphyrinogen III methyltransferase/synthase
MTVYIMGAGPGDAKFLTLEAVDILKEAEVVLYDRLIDPSVLKLAGHAKLHYVGKTPGEPHDQGEINRLLIKYSRQYDKVVRLKGGDPFVFGRGGEEAEALLGAGVNYRLVAGLSSATAAAILSGVPLTYRNVSSFFTVTTASGMGGIDVDLRPLAALGGTLVILMGNAKKAQVAKNLFDSGLDPEANITVVSRASYADQVIKELRLSELADSSYLSPAILIVGPTNKHRVPNSSGKLHSKNILLTNTGDISLELKSSLTGLGANVFHIPLIEIINDENEIRGFIDELEKKPDWVVFTSKNAIKAVLNEIADIRIFSGIKIACVGKKTEKSLEEFKLTADLVAKVANADNLAELLKAYGIEKSRILIPASSSADPNFSLKLKNAGAKVIEQKVYYPRPVDLSESQMNVLKHADAILVYSQSGALSLFRYANNLKANCGLVAIGEITYNALLSNHFNNVMCAGSPEAGDLLKSLLDFFKND